MRLKARLFGLVSVGLIAVLATLVGLRLYFQAEASRQAARIFGNTTYVIGNEYAAQMATLVDGVHDEPYLYVEYTKRYAYGDFNRDGLKDAAVIVTESGGGTGTWYTLAFLIDDGEKWVHRASRVLDDRAIINSMRVKDGKVLIDMVVHQEGDCMAGPTKRVRNAYTYEGPDRWGPIEESPYQQIYSNGTQALQGIYGTPIPAQIREAFNHTLHDHRNCSEEGCAFAVLDGEKPVDIFTKEFIVVGLGNGDSGDISATLAFKGALVPFLLEMDDLGGGRFELRKMARLPGPLGDGFIRLLQSPSYRRYWL